MADSSSLYLVRHAIAADRGDDYPDDSKRPLTGAGRSRFEKASRGLVALGVDVDVVFTSPLVRARQTAEILAHELGGRPPVFETAALAPGGSFQDLVAEIGHHSRARRIALVGHTPGIGEFAARLLGATGRLEFRKGGVCRIDVESLPPTAPGELRWFATPKMLVRLGG